MQFSAIRQPCWTQSQFIRRTISSTPLTRLILITAASAEKKGAVLTARLVCWCLISLRRCTREAWPKLQIFPNVILSLSLASLYLFSLHLLSHSRAASSPPISLVCLIHGRPSGRNTGVVLNNQGYQRAGRPPGAFLQLRALWCVVTICTIKCCHNEDGVLISDSTAFCCDKYMFNIFIILYVRWLWEKKKNLCWYWRSVKQPAWSNIRAEQVSCVGFFFFTLSYIICIDSVVTVASPASSSYTGSYAEFRKTEGGVLWLICMTNCDKKWIWLELAVENVSFSKKKKRWSC